VVVIPLLATLASSICFLMYMGIMLTALNVTDVSTRAAASVVSVMSMIMAAVRAPLMFRLTFRLVHSSGAPSAAVTALVPGSGSKEKDGRRKTEELNPAAARDPEAPHTSTAATTLVPITVSKEDSRRRTEKHDPADVEAVLVIAPLEEVTGKRTEEVPAAAKDPEAQG
jgi:hypothetical protein